MPKAPTSKMSTVPAVSAPIEVVERVRLREIIGRLDAGVSVNAEDRPVTDREHGVLKVSAVTIGHFNPDENKAVIPADLPRVGLSPRRGDLLVTRANTKLLVAAAALVPRDYPRLHLSDKIWKVVLRDPNRDDLRWLRHLLASGPVRAALVARASGTSGSMKNVSKEDFLGITVDRPSVTYQRATAIVLDTCDDAIDRVRNLLKARRKLKRGLLQLLLTGQRRFPEFRKQPWVDVPIGDLLREEERYVNWSDDEEYRLVSVRRRSGGFFDRERKRGRDILTKTLKVTHTGDFVLARMQVLHGAMTVTPPDFDGAHVSDSYMTFVPKDDTRLHMPYFGYLSSTRLMYHKALISSVGVAIEKMSFNPRWWLAEQVHIPASLEEQKKIAGVLQACDRELELLRNLHDALKEQKKGLMQKLLTGQVRVPASMLKEAVHA